MWADIKAYISQNYQPKGSYASSNHNHNSAYLGIEAKAESAKSADSVAWGGGIWQTKYFTPSSHTHDDRYYTESEINTKLSGKSDTSHTHSQYLTSHQSLSGYWHATGATWNPNANISLSATGNNQEWSFDIIHNGYTGCYFHVWDKSFGSMLKVNAYDGSVSIPQNKLYLGSYLVYVG